MISKFSISAFHETDNIEVCADAALLLIPETMCAAWHIVLLTSNWQVAFAIGRWIHTMECVECMCQLAILN